MKKTLFINADRSKPHCAVFQAGKIYADAMKLCKELDLTYVEVGDGDSAPDIEGYEVVIFNYQHVTSQIIPPAFFSYCPIAIGFLYEARQEPAASPLHFGDLLAGQVFDVLISPDPTLQSTSKVWGLPRVIKRHQASNGVRYDSEVWVSTFGFPSPWKANDEVVRMMNDEFEDAVFRINIAPASHQEGTGLQDMTIQFANDLVMIAKPGIKIRFTQHYMEDEDLVSWLAQSDVNVFLSRPERGVETGGALLASADMAISAQRPLLVSNNIEARHLSLYACAKTLREAMDPNPLMIAPVDFLYGLWSPENFAARMDGAIREYL